MLPGAADRGDVDPTSSTVALSPGGLLRTLPDALVRNTFERYWRDFSERRTRQRRRGTPTRLTNGATSAAFVRLGERERALQAMAFFYRDRRPSGWNQWAEVVLRDAREPRFLGDMPHGWVASDHIRSVLDLFAYEHEGERSLVLAAGIPMAWLDGPGLTLQDLRTPYGPLSWSGERVTDNGRTVVEIDVAARPHAAARRHRAARTVARRRRGSRSTASPVPGAADAIRLARTPAQVRIELP